MPHLTNHEAAVMKSLYHNDYGDNCEGGIWSWAVNQSREPSGIEGKALSGVISSLVKKGLLASEQYDVNENVLRLTDAGKAAMAELIGN